MAPLAIDLFARFLVAQPEGPTFDLDDLEGVEVIGRVHANFVSVRDFETAVGNLSATTRREIKMMRLVAALGFYAGLRRGEAVHLRLGDLSGRERMWLFVRSHPHHRLKRLASQRCLPLYALLPPHWLSELRQWSMMRHAEGRARSPERLLFCLAGKDDDPIRSEQLIVPIRDALRAATGDHRLVYHHLRHSFACWTLVRLLSPDLPLERWQHTYVALHDDWFDRRQCGVLRDAVLGRDRRDEPVRHAAYALARLMGHAQIGTTLRAYVHLADLLALGYQTHHQPLGLPETAVRALLGLSGPGAAYHRWRRLRNTAWRQDLGGLDPDPILEAARQATLGGTSGWTPNPGAAGERLVAPDAAGVDRSLHLEDIPALLGALFRDRLPVAEVAARFQQPPSLIQQVKMAAMQLAELRTVASGKSRFTMPPIAPTSNADGDVLAMVIRHVETHSVDLPLIRDGIDVLHRADPSRGHRILLNDDAQAREFMALDLCPIKSRPLRNNGLQRKNVISQ